MKVKIYETIKVDLESMIKTIEKSFKVKCESFKVSYDQEFKKVRVDYEFSGDIKNIINLVDAYKPSNENYGAENIIFDIK